MTRAAHPECAPDRGCNEGNLETVTACIGTGVVRHRRLRPREHAFQYRTAFLMLPMRRLRQQPCAALARNRRAALSFHDADHGDGGPDALAWLESLLRQEQVHGVDGEIWLQTYPRVLGYAFKPVSFWYGHDRAGRLRAVVAEVNNTFGERHAYLLHGDELAYGREVQARKVFHVSPFCQVAGRYRFRFMRTPQQIVARVEHDDEAGVLLQTSLSGRLQPLTARTRRAAWRAMPLLTLGVMARIHWQALRLWLKRVPFFGKPPPPSRLVTH